MIDSTAVVDDSGLWSVPLGHDLKRITSHSLILPHGLASNNDVSFSSPCAEAEVPADTMSACKVEEETFPVDIPERCHSDDTPAYPSSILAKTVPVVLSSARLFQIGSKYERRPTFFAAPPGFPASTNDLAETRGSRLRAITGRSLPKWWSASGGAARPTASQFPWLSHGLCIDPPSNLKCVSEPIRIILSTGASPIWE